MIQNRQHERVKPMPITTDPYLALVATMFRLALREVGVDWLRGPCGRWWLDRLGLSFGVVFRNYMGRWPTMAEREPILDCPSCDKDWGPAA